MPAEGPRQRHGVATNGAGSIAQRPPWTLDAPLPGAQLQEDTMPRSWTDKRERQYDHIKESYEERGRSPDKAEELAARTVNKERSEAGETKASKKR
jgi:hypothetical protein